MTDAELCRLCAESKEELVGIYDLEGQKLAVERKIIKCLGIQVSITDCLPLGVCVDCCQVLSQCYDFYERTNKAQKSLHELFNEQKEKIPEPIPPLPIHENYISNKDFIKEHGYATDKFIDVQSDKKYFENKTSFNSINHMGIEQEINSNNREPEFKKKMRVSSNFNKKYKQKSTLHHSFQHLDSEKFSTKESIESNLEIPENPTENYAIEGLQPHFEFSKNKSTQNSESLENNIYEVLDNYSWLCTDCNDKLPNLEALRVHHSNVHNQKTKFMCIQCCKVFEKYFGFIAHVKRHKKKAKYDCSDCGKSFFNKKIWDSHKSMHTKERPFICQTCGKAFRQQSALHTHKKCHLPKNMRNKFPCDQCDKRFSTKPNLATHKRIHSGVKNFTCDQCGKSFVQKGNLEAHFLTHTSYKPFNCTTCAKAFKTALLLKKHESVHTGAKPHQCSVCGRTFREKGTLKEHYRIHTGAMPFSCEFCGKRFRFKGILTTHRRQHTGERPYSCQECQHHFTNWPNYNKHMKRRHGINGSQNKNSQYFQQQDIPVLDSLGFQQSISEISTSTPDQEAAAGPQMNENQQIILQSIPINGIQTFDGGDLQGRSIITQDCAFSRKRNANYFNLSASSLPSFVPQNLTYNFYNIQSVGENELLQNK